MAALKTYAFAQGNAIDYTPGSDKTAGTPIQIAGRIGVPSNDIASGVKGALAVSGLFKGMLAADTVTAGDQIGWDANGSPYGGTALSGAYTNDSTNWDFSVGIAAYAATNTSGIVYFFLNVFANAEILDEGDLNDPRGNEVIILAGVASAVNEITVSNAATGNAPSMAATGDDTDIDVDVAGKGTGAVNLGQATSTGVKLVADQPILDSSDNELIEVAKTASAVNHVKITNAATNNDPQIEAAGADTNMDLLVEGKGTGGVQIAAATKASFFGAAVIAQISHVADPGATASDFDDQSGGSASGTHQLVAMAATGADALDTTEAAKANANMATLAVEYNLLKDDVEANNALIDTILTSLETIGIHAVA